jgi:signal transduction histidine kinase
MTGAFTFAIALLLLAGGVALTRQSRRTAEKRAQELLRSAHARANFELNEPDNVGHPPLKVVREEQGELAAGDVALLMLDDKGREVWRSRATAPHWPLHETEREAWRADTIDMKGQTLVLALPWTETEKELRELAGQLLALGSLVVAASALGAWILVGRTLAPIDRLSHQVQNATPDRLRVRLSAPSSDAEIVHLVGTINGLLERLATDAASRGRFYAAASHELRTPLQALVGELDVILSRPRAGDEYRETIVEVQRQALRLTALVQELLQLNQLEMASAPPQSAPVNLADLVERQWRALLETASRSDLQTEFHLPDLEVQMPPAHAEMICRNLLENAIKYAAPGGRVRVAIEEWRESVHLEVWNDTSTAPETDLSLWLEPFYRPDAARNSQTGGNGLGLAICKAICATNGWEIDLHNNDDGVNVRVKFKQ